MTKSKILIVGAFPQKGKVVYGGIAKSCEVLLQSSIIDRFPESILIAASSLGTCFIRTHIFIYIILESIYNSIPTTQSVLS